MVRLVDLRAPLAGVFLLLGSGIPVNAPRAADVAATPAAPIESLLQQRVEGEPADEDFPSCATVCQRRLDKALPGCSLSPGTTAKQDEKAGVGEACIGRLQQAFQSCLASCHSRWPGNRDKYR